MCLAQENINFIEACYYFYIVRAPGGIPFFDFVLYVNILGGIRPRNFSITPKREASYLLDSFFVRTMLIIGSLYCISAQDVLAQKSKSSFILLHIPLSDDSKGGIA